MQRILSFDQTPPLSGPLRFFLSAPLFSVAAAMLLFWQGPEALSSRWSPATLALTHLMTLGFLSMSMIGALLQILPVVAGIVIFRQHLTASAVHALLTAGAAMLAAAFWWSQPALFKFALLFLAPAFAWLLVACAIGLWHAHAPNASATVVAIRLAIAALLATIILGAALGSAFAWPLALPLMLLTDLHVLWGLLGWVGLLAIGVAFQVIPMFQVTPLYPRQITRWLAWTLFMLLIVRSIAGIIFQQPPHWIAAVLSAMILAGFVVFAAATLYLLWRRKRPKADATTLFWRTAMASLLGCAAVWIMRPATDHASYSLALGALFIVGFAYSAINGMLYKIVPFLLWYHLQSNMAADGKSAPGIQQLLPDSVAVKQFWVHLAALLLLVAAAIWPAALARAAALALCISAGALELNLLNALQVFLRVKRLGALVSARI
jgi:hypothetical protein